MNRWKATIKYRSDVGLIEETHEVEELYETHSIVEAGYHWDCLIELLVERKNHSFRESLNVEASAEL